MWLSNDRSAKQIQDLAMKAQKACAEGLQGLAAIGAHGTNIRNMSRSLKRKAARQSKLQPLYWADIPVWDDLKKSCVLESIPFLLPHETVYTLIQSGLLSLFVLCSVVGTAMQTVKDTICSKLQVDPANHILFGIHTDGVPIQRSGATVEVQSFNFPAEPKMEQLLWNVLEKSYLCRCGC